MIKRLSIIKESDTKPYRDIARNFEAHPRVASLLQHGYHLDFKILPKLSKIPLFLSEYHNKNKDGALHEAVQAMRTKKEIVHVRKPTTLGYYSRLFLVPKPLKRWRPVIGLSILNSHLHVPTFKMETAESIWKSIRYGEWVTSIDLTDAYFHVPIHHQSQKYLRFQTMKGVFQFHALPFGVATAPLEFTWIVKEVKLIAQVRNLRIHQYLDDWLLRSPTKEQCLVDSQNLVKLVQELGWLINFQKSELIPMQKLDFLGYHFDLQRGLVFPTPKKLDWLKNQTISIRKSLVLTPRKLMSVIGTLSSIEKTVPLGRLHMRPFQWYLKSHWKFPQSLDKRIQVTVNFLKHLKWWEDLQNLMAGAPINPHVHNNLVFTDASQKGWGAHLNDLVSSGLWSNKESQPHINVLELKAVLLALKGLQEHLQGKRVLICSDNSTVVSYLNKEGGTHSIEMCTLIWRILAFTNSRRIQIRARHVPGSLNEIADSLSRRDKVIQTEWSLHQQIFNQICRVWHTPMVDLFATHLNHKLPIYVSPVPDKKAWKMDALNICSEGLDSYVFCSVAILPQVVKKIITYPCRMIVLAPGWQGCLGFGIWWISRPGYPYSSLTGRHY